MSTTWTCPQCDALILMEDVNPSADLALCRTCGQTHSFEGLVQAEEFGDVDLRDMPKGIRIVPDPMVDRRIISQRMSPAVFFLVPFTLLWGGGSMFGIYGTQFASGSFQIGQSLFGIPFLIGTIALVSVTLFMLRGRTEIALHRGEGTIFVGLGSIGRPRRFTYDRGTQVLLTKSGVSRNNVPQEQVTLRHDGVDVSFGALGMNDAGRQAVAAMIHDEVRRA